MTAKEIALGELRTQQTEQLKVSFDSGKIGAEEFKEGLEKIYRAESADELKSGALTKDQERIEDMKRIESILSSDWGGVKTLFCYRFHDLRLTQINWASLVNSIKENKNIPTY